MSKRRHRKRLMEPAVLAQVDAPRPVPVAQEPQSDHLTPCELSGGANIEQELGRLRSRYADARARSRKLLAALRRDRESLHRLMEQQEGTNTLQRQLSDSQQALAEAEEKIARFAADLRDEQRAVARATANIQSLEQLLAKQSEELSNAASTIESVDQRIEEERSLGEVLEKWHAERQARKAERAQHSAGLVQRTAGNEHFIAEREPTFSPQVDELSKAGGAVSQLRASHALTAEDSSSQPRDGRDAQPVGSESTSGEDENSIEQYIATYMQRLRGEPSFVSAAPSHPTTAGGNGTTVAPSVESQPAPPNTRALKCDERPSSDLSNLVRKDPIQERLVNFDALRTLANDTARQAISVHSTRQHRRNAVTKFIVAMLAGFTGLWLMILAPSRLDSQFAVACALLVIAAYWAGQTFAAPPKLVSPEQRFWG